MLAPYVDLLFVATHFALLLARLARTNSYGPAAIAFTAFFDVFFALPVYLDFFLGAPGYERFSGISAAVGSESVRARYDVIVLTLAAAFSWFLRQRRIRTVPRKSLGFGAVAVALVVAYGPVLYVTFSGNLGLYREYGAIITSPELQLAAFHTTVGFLSGLSFVGAGLLFVAPSRARSTYTWRTLFVLPALAADVWLVGKRSSVAFLLLILGLTVLDRHRHAIKLRHGLLGVGMASALLGFSWLYQSALRPDTQIDTVAAYETLRLDMGRDHDLKLAIYNEVNDSGTPTLEYRMQSFLFVATIFIPRVWWPDKPWPYAVYATSAALDRPVQDWGWGLTTDLFSESVANMGLFGLVPCWAFFTWAVRRVDRSNDALVLLLGTLCICSLLVLQFAAVSVWHFSLLGYWLGKRLLHSPAALALRAPTSSDDDPLRHLPVV